MKCLISILFLFLFWGCVNVSQNDNSLKDFNAVKIEIILKRPESIRALHVCENHIFYGASGGEFGYLNTADNSVAYIGQVEEAKDLEFRAISRTKEADYILSAGNPALLYKVNYFGKRKLSYKEEGEKVFYDAMAFYDDLNGIAMGDPTKDCISILITKDGGENWEKVPCEKLPSIIEGEAAFAASNTNISIVEDKVWIATGGKTSRIYFSEDMGESWEVYNTPIISGKSTTGIYSLDFYNESTGIVIGGDYTNPEGKQQNKAITKDGGKTWKIMAEGKEPGYKSCIKFVPNSNAREIVAVGFTGISYSSDYGRSWKQLSEEPFYTISFLNDYTAYAAGKGRIAKLVFIENGPKQEVLSH